MLITGILLIPKLYDKDIYHTFSLLPLKLCQLYGYSYNVEVEKYTTWPY